MIALTLALALAISAEAAPRIQPELNAKACFSREYEEEHMRANPKQHVSKLHVLVNRTKSADDADGTYTSVKVVGEREGVLYGNEATCEAKEGNHLHCFIECDGGSFELKEGRNARRVNFEITKDYYFPLYRRGANPEEARPEDTLSFSPDRDNGVYRLQRSEPGVCEKRWKQFKKTPAFGC